MHKIYLHTYLSTVPHALQHYTAVIVSPLSVHGLPLRMPKQNFLMTMIQVLRLRSFYLVAFGGKTVGGFAAVLYGHAVLHQDTFLDCFLVAEFE